eukprot:m.27760 g.27760  ORF g.27760 m.27760 type:complete len:990 (+) comp8630_c0_seq1:162-3131(+)
MQVVAGLLAVAVLLPHVQARAADDANGNTAASPVGAHGIPYADISRNCDLTGDWVGEDGTQYLIHQGGDGNITITNTNVGPGHLWTTVSAYLYINVVYATFPVAQHIAATKGFVYSQCQRINWGAPRWQPDTLCPKAASNGHIGCTWSRPFPDVKKVHMVYMTHWDTTFTDTRQGVCDVYLNGTGKCQSAEPHYCDSGNGHFIDAMNTSQQLRTMYPEEDGPRFVYTSWPWLVQEYLDNTARCATAGRTAAEVAAFEAAIGRGDIAWNGKALNLLPEMADPVSYTFSLGVSARLNARYNTTWGTLAAKSADVAGISRAAVPLLAGTGFRMLHLGYNAQCVTPHVPSLSVWRDPLSGAEIVLCISDTYGADSVPNEYSDNGNRSYRLHHHIEHLVPLGHKKKQQGDNENSNGTTSLGSEALVFLYTVDNRQPPNASEVARVWKATQRQFPNAVVRATSLDAYAKHMWDQRSALPVFTNEIGDTWNNGAGSDPWRVAVYRLVIRLRDRAVARGDISAEDPDLAAYNFRLLNHPEHNWGLSAVTKYPGKPFPDCNKTVDCWNNTDFHRVRKRQDWNYFSSSWVEGRDYLFPATPERGWSAGFRALVADIRTQVALLTPSSPPTHRAVLANNHTPAAATPPTTNTDVPLTAGHDTSAVWKRSDQENLTAPNTTATAANGSVIEVPCGEFVYGINASTGALSWLHRRGAGPASRAVLHQGGDLGTLLYRTYDDADYLQFNLLYNPNGALQNQKYGYGPVNKPNVRSANPESKTWGPQLQAVYRVAATPTFSGAGARQHSTPSPPVCSVLTHVTLPERAHTMYGAPKDVYFNATTDGKVLRLALEWFDKTPTRLPEATFVHFDLRGQGSSPWAADVLGTPILPSEVVVNGSTQLFAVASGLVQTTKDCEDEECVKNTTPSVATERGLRSLDAPLALPGLKPRLLLDGGLVSPHASDPHAWSFNLHNNHWGVAFPQWFPYQDFEANMRFRFELDLF